MAQIPWIPVLRPEPDRDYIAVVTYLPLKSLWALPQLLYYLRGIRSQLRSSRGLIGYSVFSHVLAKRFWTLSVWDSEVDLVNFIHNQPHNEAMMVLRRFMGGTAFVRWVIRGSSVPPSWQEAWHGQTAIKTRDDRHGIIEFSERTGDFNEQH